MGRHQIICDFSSKIAESFKDEWIVLEEDSFEEAGRPEKGHVVNIIRNSVLNKIVCTSPEDTQILLNATLVQREYNDDQVNLGRVIARVNKEILNNGK